MSDMMQRPMPRPGGAPGGMPGGAPGGMGGMPNNRMKQNETILNPNDLAAKATRGEVNPQMTIRDFLESELGVDVDGPVSQLASALKGQAQKASPLGKVRAMGGAQGGIPGERPSGGGAPGMEGLINTIGRPPSGGR